MSQVVRDEVFGASVQRGLHYHAIGWIPAKRDPGFEPSRHEVPGVEEAVYQRVHVRFAKVVRRTVHGATEYFGVLRREREVQHGHESPVRDVVEHRERRAGATAQAGDEHIGVEDDPKHTPV